MTYRRDKAGHVLVRALKILSIRYSVVPQRHVTFIRLEPRMSESRSRVVAAVS